MVTDTDPRLNLVARAGSMKLPYRLHTRHCERCGSDFEAVAIPKFFLDVLTGHAQRTASLERELADEKGKVEALREQLQQVADVALSKSVRNGALTHL